MPSRPQDLVSRDGSGTVFFPDTTVASDRYDGIRASVDDGTMTLAGFHLPGGGLGQVDRAQAGYAFEQR
ncbi:MAG: hypothetical protein ACJASC_003415 [Limimaricola cinnabarinus]|jgi:hypothetical protein